MRAEVDRMTVSHLAGSSPKQCAFVWILAIVLTFLSIATHITSPSTIHFSDGKWKEVIDHHRDNDIFTARPLTTGITTFLAEHSGLNWRFSFFGLQFFLFLLSGPAFYYYLRSLAYAHRYSIAGMVIYMLSLPIFLAHFEPVHTWSDFWVYLFVPLSLAFTIRRSYIPAVLAMAVALLARETTLLFLPILALIVYENQKGSLLRAVLLPLVSFLIYICVKVSLIGISTASPDFTLYFNFESWIRTRDSIFSITVSLGFLWVIGLKQVIFPLNQKLMCFNIIRFGAGFTTIGFVLSSLLFGRVRESRLLMPIAIFLIPLTLDYYESHSTRLRLVVEKYLHSRLIRIGFMTLLISVSIILSKLIFPDFEYRRWRDGNWIYMGIHIAIVIVFLTLELIIKYEKLEQSVA